MLSTKKILLVGYRKDAIRRAIDCFSNVEILVPEGTKVSKSLEINKVYYYSNEEETPIIDELPDLCLPLSESSVVMASLITEEYRPNGYSSRLINSSHDKVLLKNIAHKNSIPISKFQVINSNTKAEDLINHLKLPIVIKQRSSSGSRGLQLCENLKDVKNHLFEGWIAESFIEGKEYSAEVFIQNGKILFTNFTDYLERLKINVLPHKFSNAELILVQQLIEKVINAYEINTAFLHIEFFLNNNKITFGEFAIRPPGGYLMKLIKHSYNIDPWELYYKLFLNEKLKPVNKPFNYSSAIILHPGSGTIKEILGEEHIRSLDSFYSFKIKKNIGDIINEREGSGQDIGYIILINKDQKALYADIESVQKNFHIILK